MERIGIYIGKEDALKEITNKFFSNNTTIKIKENVIYCYNNDKLYLYFFDENFELKEEYFDYIFIKKDINDSFYNKLLEKIKNNVFLSSKIKIIKENYISLESLIDVLLNKIDNNPRKIRKIVYFINLKYKKKYNDFLFKNVYYIPPSGNIYYTMKNDSKRHYADLPADKKSFIENIARNLSKIDEETLTSLLIRSKI